MSKRSTSYRCTECGHRELRWMGRCPECAAWNSLEISESPSVDDLPPRRRRGAPAELSAPTPIQQIPQPKLERLPVEPPELGRLLGGGLVAGSLVLLGGAPGVGKSTLLTMLAGQIAASGRSVVYLSAEESAAQVRARARRLDADRRGFFLLEQPVLEHVMPALYQDPPTLLVVDSIQSVLSQDVEGVAGGVSQIRMCGSLLADFARGTGCAVVVIGHVTKEGELAGPRLLEHLVDTVLYFEPDAEGSVRIIRAFKNRFGRTGELVVLEMGESGLSPVRDASALFLAGRQKGEPGSCVSAILSGTRPLLVELQALLVRSQYAAPTRVVTGLDSKRVAQLAAILASKGRIESLGHDVYVKVAGGLYVTDPGTDLGLVLAMTSSLKALELPADLLAVGEVGLTGELRAVPQLGARLEEAQAHGFQRAVVASHEPRRLPRLSDMQIAAVANVREALGATFGRERSLRRAEGS